MASGKATSDVADGPVLVLINNRIRNLRKKLKRIAQLEDSIAQGKSIITDKEQEEFLKSKPSIIGAVDELEKLRQPVSVKVHEEITLALRRHHMAASEDNDSNKTQTLNEEQAVSPVDDLLSLFYFGSLFNPKPASDFDSVNQRAVHERKACLMYDYFAYDRDRSVRLRDEDLDMMGLLASLMTLKPEGSGDTHQNALQRCTEHANRWLSWSWRKIALNRSSISYADLREKLTKLMSLDYMVNHPDTDVGNAIVEKAGLQKGALDGFVLKGECGWIGDEYPIEGIVVFTEEDFLTEAQLVEAKAEAEAIAEAEAEAEAKAKTKAKVRVDCFDDEDDDGFDYHEEPEDWKWQPCVRRIPFSV